ncbi:MAG: alpha-D-ribose 1-methylphosphonate 5-triphosphate diphosphatase [Capsulimonadales bacterium]|nr:alpha-D-ribose 1-methylphosphonate 5-triphosphate diphosphatase [Capsulimonadales bacterium]
MNRVILTDARVVLPDRAEEASVLVEDGRIADIVPGRRFPEGVSLAGQYLVPGLIDLHTDYLEREARPRSSADFPLAMAFHFMDTRAIGAGITTVLGAARITERKETSERIIGWDGDGLALAHAYQELRRKALARHFVHLRWDPNFLPVDTILSRLRELDSLGNLVFNDSTPGERQFRNLDELIRNYAFQRKVSPEEARAHFDARIERGRTINNRGAVQAALGDRLPLGSHDDATIEHVDEAYRFGATLAEMPVTIEAARRAKELGMDVCMGAPNYYRGGSHCGNLAAPDAVAEGLVDIFCSDFHFPAMLGAAMRMLKAGMAAPDVFRYFTRNPARHLRLDHELGSIEIGKKADLTAFVPHDDFGLVTHVWIDGELRYRIAHPSSAP